MRCLLELNNIYLNIFNATITSFNINSKIIIVNIEFPLNPIKANIKDNINAQNPIITKKFNYKGDLILWWIYY